MFKKKNNNTIKAYISNMDFFYTDKHLITLKIFFRKSYRGTLQAQELDISGQLCGLNSEDVRRHFLQALEAVNFGVSGKIFT